MTIRILLASSGLLFLGSIGAFFLFVPVLSIAIVGLILVALALMFGLGFQAGAHHTQPAESSRKESRSALLTIPSHVTGYGYLPAVRFFHLRP